MDKKSMIIGGIVLLVIYYLWSKGKLSGLATIANGTMYQTMTAAPSPVTQATNNAAAGVIGSIGTSISNFFSGNSSTPNAPT